MLVGWPQADKYKLVVGLAAADKELLAQSMQLGADRERCLTVVSQYESVSCAALAASSWF